VTTLWSVVRAIGPSAITATCVVVVLGLSPVRARVEPRSASPDELIQAAVRGRVGAAVTSVAVVGLDAESPIVGEFKSVRLDPAASFGKPIRLTLVPARGPSIIAVATVRVVAEHVVAARDINRGETLTAGDIVTRRDEVRGIPMRRLPRTEEVVGARTLRAVPAGTVFLPGAVALRRLVEAGDRVTVVAKAGDAEVSAVLVAADAGDPGDVIRVSNPETRRQLRGRVVSSGVVEVLHVR
jgi:flagella basal body P-ring formation protein FlgA